MGELLEVKLNVCAVIVGRIGDTVLTTPILEALRARHRHLTVMAHPKRIEVLQNLDFIDDLQPLTKRSAVFKSRLSKNQYDLALCWGADDALFAFCQRSAKKTIAFAQPNFLSKQNGKSILVPVPASTSMHALKERALLLEEAGIDLSNRRLRYSVTPLEREQADHWLRQEGLLQAGPLIGIQAFSFHTKSHRDWPLKNFNALVQLISQQFPSAKFIFFGDKSSRELLNDSPLKNNPAVNLAAGKLTLRESAAVMSALDLYIGVDTGPTHIAGAFDVPMVALYHPLYPGNFLKPLGHPNCIVVQAPQEMNQLTVGSVYDAVLKALYVESN